MRLLSHLLTLSVALSTTAVSAVPSSSLSKRDIAGTQMTNCDLSKANLPRRGSAPQVPAPSDGLRLKYALIGAGTQNYTCSGEKPEAIGAEAILYDASCLAAYHEALLHEMIGGFLQFGQGQHVLAAAVLGRFSNEHMVVGHHYFRDDKKTAVFDLRGTTDDDKDDKEAVFVGHKTASVEAPSYSTKGKDDQGDGAVPWLKLKGTSESVSISEGFRMITAGGQPPKSCSGQKDHIEVPYAAEYYFYG